MKLRSVEQAEVKGKRVLIRCGFDVPFSDNGVIEDDERIQECIPTLRFLLDQGASLILMAHNGRPKGKVVSQLSMKPIGMRLEQLLREKVDTLDDCVGEEIQARVRSMIPGDIVLLENLRFHKEEKKNDQAFAKELASYGDIYVNEAFANIHRDHASMTSVARMLPAYAGLRLVKEVETLFKVIESPEHPFVAIIGGAKISDKIQVIKRLLDIADYVMLGGALANTILKAMGISVGRSIVEEKMMDIAKELTLIDNRLRVPVDVVTASDISKDAKTTVKAVANVDDHEYILDIGPDTVKLYGMIINKAKTVVWGGPMGYYELPPFDEGTNDLAEIVGKSPAFTVAGGGDTLDALQKSGRKDHISFTSTGGGAMLSFLEGATLPALELLKEK